jgi:hypothetical protein
MSNNEMSARAVCDLTDPTNATFVRFGETDEQAAKRIGATQYEINYLPIDVDDYFAELEDAMIRSQNV